MLGQWSYLLFIIGLLNIILGLLVSTRNWRSRIHLSFAGLSFAIGLWVIGIAGFGIAKSDEMSFVMAKLFYIAPLFVGVFFVYFTKLFPDAKRLSTAVLLTPLMPVLLLVTALVSVPNFITANIVQVEWGRSVVVNQSQYAAYALVIVGLFGYALFTLWQKTRRLKGMYYTQVQRFFVMGAIVSIIAIWFNVILAHWLGDYRYVWVGPLATTLYLFSNAIGIARHRMFDIRTAAVRSLAYILSVVALSGIYFGLAYVVSTTFFAGVSTDTVSMSPVNIALALVLVLVFQPLKTFFDHLTSRLFYRDRYDANEFIARLGHIVTSTAHLDELLTKALEEIVTTLKATGGSFIIYRDHHNDALVGDRTFTTFSERDYELVRNITDVRGSGLLMVEPTQRSGVEVVKIMSMLSRKRIGIVLPLVSARETVGYLLLGEQLGAGYGQRDVKVLETIANELVIAIMNARSVQVVRDLNANLEERVSHATRQLLRSNKRLLELDATKDEFLSMASHQLRTPLTSVKGYISMVLEGDVGDITPPQRHLLEEAYTSSERMVHLIGDFLNVSRLQTGRFVVDPKRVNLAKLVRQEVDSIQQIATTHDISIDYTEPKRFPELYMDEGKIRQVVMNFIDNAIYYSPNTVVIKVSLRIEDGDAVVRVVDKGIGVPQAVQKKLFGKFFRAENARRQRPDGTGIGLYLAKKVIDGHGGKLVFESREGKGSTFGFRLPIRTLSSPPEPQVISE